MEDRRRLRRGKLPVGDFGTQGVNLEAMINSRTVSELVVEDMSAVMPGQGHTYD